MLKHKKNDVITAKIIELGINGEGVAKLEDGPVFVPFTLPNELVEVRIIKVEKTFYIGKLERVLEKSPHRTVAPCPVFTKCGGCQLQHLSYFEQLNFKTKLVKDTLLKVGYIDANINHTIRSEKEYNYRNKISLPVRSVNNEVKFGFYATNSHRIVEVDACPLQEHLTNKVISVFQQFMLDYQISAFDEEKNIGLVKHLVAREFNNHLLVAVVINGKNMPNAQELYKMLTKEFKTVTLYLNHNTLNNNVILGEVNTLIGGTPTLEEELQGIVVKTGVVSFMQINNDIRNKMYEEAVNKINAFSPEVVVDAFSGAGLLSGILAKNTSAKVVGLEIVEEAVEAANKMLSENGLEHRVQNILGDCSVTLPAVIKNTQGKTTLLVDPPRKGLDKTIIAAILESKPEQIIYIACGLTTLARDLGYLLNTKHIETEEKIKTPQSLYELVSVTPYDMFPQTKHVETLVELKLKG